MRLIITSCSLSLSYLSAFPSLLHAEELSAGTFLAGLADLADFVGDAFFAEDGFAIVTFL